MRNMDRKLRWLLLLQLLAMLSCAAAAADKGRGIRLGEEMTSKWRFGVVVKATGGAVSGVTATLPVPMDWPEQTVKRIGEEKTPQVGSITCAVLGSAAKQPSGVKRMMVKIPRLAAGDEA